MKLCNK